MSRDNSPPEFTIAGGLQYNDRLAQRQAEVRTALEELYGTASAAVSPSPSPTAHTVGRSILLDDDDDDDDGSLSFDALVVHDSGDGINMNIMHPTSSLHQHQHEHQHENQHHYNVDNGEDDSGNDSDSETDSGSASSFSLSELGDDSTSSIGTMDINNHTTTAAAAQTTTSSTSHHEAYRTQENTPSNVMIHKSMNRTPLNPHPNPPQHYTHHGNTNDESSINNNNTYKTQIKALQNQLQNLQTQNNNLQEEVDLGKADKVLLSPTKYQVELDSMRLVADQLQIEAEERVAIVENECMHLRTRLDAVLLEGRADANANNYEFDLQEQEQHAAAAGWRMVFYSLVEQLCLLEESGLRKDATLRMDQLVKDVVGMMADVGDEELEEYLHRLEQGCGSNNVLDSIVSQEADASPFSPMASNKSSPSPAGKYVSVGVDTEDLQSPSVVDFDRHYPSNSLPSISELQLENASLKGSNEHMKEQIGHYKQQLVSLKASSNGVSFSPLITNNLTTRPHDNELKQENAQLHQEIHILTEGQRVVEEENFKVVQRCVELENVAEDATRECEGLMETLGQVEKELRSVEDERDELMILHEAYEEATNNQEIENRRFRDEVTRDHHVLQDKYDTLMESSNAFEQLLDSLGCTKVRLEAELEDAKGLAAKQSDEMVSLQSELGRAESERPDMEDKLMKLSEENQALAGERDDLLKKIEELQKSSNAVGNNTVVLEDDCSRLRNLNSMIKAKIEVTESELSKVKEQNSDFVKQISSLRRECDSVRIENVFLSDTKTDIQVELRNYEKKCTDLNALVARVEKELGKVISLRDELQKQNASLMEQVSSKEEALKNANEQICGLSKEKVDMESTNENLVSECSELKERLKNEAIVAEQKRVVLMEETRSSVGSSRTGTLPPRKQYYASQGTVGVQTPKSGDGPRTMNRTFPTSSAPTPTPTLSTVRSSLFNSLQKSGTNACLAFTPGSAGSMQSMDDQLERIKFAKERAMRTLKNVSTVLTKTKATGSTTLSSKTTRRLDETEAIVNEILNSCGKQKLQS